jgi:arylsulfatase A
MEALAKNGFSENTLIIATADNGAAGRTYAPLKACKRSIYEGGHRVQFIARWPGKIKAYDRGTGKISKYRNGSDRH